MDKQLKLLKCYENLVQYYFANSKVELDLDDKPYTDLLDLLHPISSQHPFFERELFMQAVSWHVESLEEPPEQFSDNDINLLETAVERVFDCNMEKHFIIFPLQGSRLKADISFSHFHFITKKDEQELIQQISTISGIDETHIESFLEHTTKSRSKDFLKSNLLVIEMEHQSETVRQSAFHKAQQSINLLLLMCSAFGKEPDTFYIRLVSEEPNSHVAILSDELWRCGHGHGFGEHLKCNADLDFMQEPKHQALFEKMHQTLASTRQEGFREMVQNAFLLYAKGMMQKNEHRDDSLALTLYIVALESLLAEERNEKRLRLAAIIPQLIEIDGMTSPEMAREINDFYKLRNNFLHAGKQPYFAYEGLSSSLCK